jgi:hypothetical protein
MHLKSVSSTALMEKSGMKDVRQLLLLSRYITLMALL